MKHQKVLVINNLYNARTAIINQIIEISLHPEIIVDPSKYTPSSTVIEYGRWLLREIQTQTPGGQPNKNSKIASDSLNGQQILETNIVTTSICQDISMTLLSTPDNTGQIITVDVQWLESVGDFRFDSQAGTTADKLYYLEFLKNLLKNNHECYGVINRIYLVSQQRRSVHKTQSQVRKYMEILKNQTLGLVYFRQKHGQIQTTPNSLNNILLDQNNLPINKQRVSFIDIMDQQKHDQLSENYEFSFSKKLQKENLMSILRKKRGEIQHFIVQYFSSFEKITKSILNQEQQNSQSSLSAVAQLVIYYDSLPTQNLENLPLMKSVFEIQRVSDSQKRESVIMNQNIIKKIFLSQFRELYQDFKQQFKLQGESIERVKQFFKNVFKKLQIISTITDNEISKLYNLIYILLQQIEIFKILTKDRNRQFLTQSIIDKIEGFIPKQAQILSILLKMQITANEQIQYYNDLEHLLKQNLTSQNYISNAEYEKIKQKVNASIHKIILFRSKKLFYLYNDDKNNKKIAQGIYNLLKLYRQMMQDNDINIEKFDQNWNQILRICAIQLRHIAKPTLALQIYKKQKMIFKIEECLRQMICDAECTQSKQSQLFIDIANYFIQIKQANLSHKYLQLAFQLDINSSQKRQNFFRNAQYNNKIADNFSYRLDNQQFWDEITKMQEQEQVNQSLHVKISKKKMNSIINKLENLQK